MQGTMLLLFFLQQIIIAQRWYREVPSSNIVIVAEGRNILRLKKVKYENEEQKFAAR